MRRIHLAVRVISLLALLMTTVSIIASSPTSQDAEQNGSWVRQWLASAAAGIYSSLVLDEYDNPSIAFYDQSVGVDIEYLHFTGSGWTHETIIEGLGGNFLSLALSDPWRPHLSFQGGNTDLYYCHGTLYNMDCETVDAEGDTGYGTSLALDADDRPHISYYDSTNGDLKYAHWTSDNWEIETVDSDVDFIFSDISLALDAADRPHVSYYCNGDLKYAHWTGSHWESEIVDRWTGWYPSLALDSSGRVHISYQDHLLGEKDLRYAHQTGSGWETETVDSEGEVGSYTSLALDSSDRPHISYYDRTNENLKYAHWTGDTWEIETVDSSGRNGLYNSLALDSGNLPHISYFNYSSGGLMYAYKDAPADTTPPTIDVYLGTSKVINRNLCPGPVLSLIGATVEDPYGDGGRSGLDWVRLYYSLNGGSESHVELDLDGEDSIDFGHMMGPFDEAGVVSWYIRARDKAGNLGQSPTYVLTVNDCPGCSSWTTDFWPPDDGFRFENLNVGDGQCVGMSIAALDYYESQHQIPPDYNYWVEPPGSDPDNPLSCYIQRCNLWAWATAAYDVAQWAFIGDETLINGQEYEKIKSRMRDDAKPALVSLGTVNSHSIVVYAVTECTDGRVSLFAYDSNKVQKSTGAYPALVEGHFTDSGLEIDSTSTKGKNGQSYSIIFASFASSLLRAPQVPDLGSCTTDDIDQAYAEVAETGYEIDPTTVGQGHLDQGEEMTYQFINTGESPSAVFVSWSGSRLRLEVHRPDGSLFTQAESSQSPLFVEIPQGEENGIWIYKIAAVDVPYDDYPYITLIGHKYLIYLPVILKSW